MSTAHYFSSDPEGPFERRRISAALNGAEVAVSTSGGIFSPDGLDKGTAVLLKHVPDPSPEGELLDIGCGWGPIALTMAQRSPDARVWAVDINARSRTLCAENAASLGLSNVIAAAPEEVPTDLRFSTIWSNPPIRVGKAALHDILLSWLPRLDADAEAWLVVQKNLGADSLQKWLAASLPAEHSVDRPETDKGFRLLRVRR